MSFSSSVAPKLLAFDLDGTLLTTKKELSPATVSMLHTCFLHGMKIVFASGRIKSSIEHYSGICPFPVSILSLNGAAVYSDPAFGAKKIYSASLPAVYADFLIEHAQINNILLNYYYNDALYAIKNERTDPWITLYFQQTGSEYMFVPSFDTLRGNAPSKIIFVGEPEILDQQQKLFTEKWGDSVYICRTWDYYLEFLNPKANKGSGLSALAQFYGIPPEQVAAFGDATNDIPMLQYAGMSVALKNAGEEVKKVAGKISPWSNDQDAVARELELLLSQKE